MTSPTARRLFGGAALALAAGFFAFKAGAEEPHLVPAPAIDAAAGSAPTQTAVLSGGCFWGVQGVFEHVKGVKKVYAGYSGGAASTADYETVSSGTTGHAESVKIIFDPHEISYGRILQVFFSVALDPTMRNAQGPDEGTQYRSEIFYADPEQQRVAKAYVAQLDAAHAYSAPIATRVDALTGFYAAEAYHQDFLVNHPDYPYIAINDMPKVEALKALFPGVYQAQPVLAGKPGS
jgi:peptide-methionine (S)-S-oxide reductase